MLKSPSCLLAVLLSGGLPALFAAPLVPDYPVSAIVQPDPREAQHSATSLTAAVAVARMAYTDDGPALRAALAARSGQTPPMIVYMGGFTTNHGDILWLENEYRRGIAMVDVAKLGADLDASTSEFNLAEPRGGELAVTASTADGVDLNDKSKYCYWIRIDDELMKVTKVDVASGRVTVQRGFDKSAAVTHRAGAVVLGPVYLGNRDRMTARASSAWPGATSRIRYALNPNTAEAQAFKARCVVEVMKAGYDGAWWDTFQPQPFNLCDGVGRKIDFVWDYTTGKRFDFRSSLEGLKNYTRAVRALVKQATGREPILYGNSVSGTYARGGKELMNSPTVHDLLDGYCFEDSYLDVKPAGRNAGPAKSPAGEPMGPPATYERVTGDLWLRNVSGQADAAQLRVHALCMAGAAGYLGGRFNDSLHDYDDLLRYSYASYLLTVTADRATSFGLPLLVASGPGRTASAEAWPALLFAGIGDPVQPNDLAALKVKDSGCYARQFTNGFVAVYPQSSGSDVEVPLPANLVDAQTGKPVTSLRLAPGGAAVLVRRKS